MGMRENRNNSNRNNNNHKRAATRDKETRRDSERKRHHRRSGIKSVGHRDQRTKEAMSSPIPPISLASFIASSVDPSVGLAELAADLDRPQSARDHKEEIELFFELPEDEQRRYLRSLLTFVDEVAPRCLDVPRPSRLHPVQCLNLFVKGLPVSSLSSLVRGACAARDAVLM